MKTPVYDLDGKACSEIDLPDAIFGIEARGDILARVIRWQLAKRRSGTHAVKGRSDVAGSTKKIVKQKGSGGARHGSKRGAQFRGGGIIFGPTPRDHSFDLPKKVRKLGLKMALAEKLALGKLRIVQDFNLADNKTKTALNVLKGLDGKKVLFVDGGMVNANMARATSNIIGLDVLPQIGANVYDIVRKDQLVLTVEAVQALGERLK